MARKLWRGNTGSSVRELQQKLNQNGYHLDEDGVFGSNTYRAVVDYQKKNKLLVDGVVGDETWGSLNKVQQAAVPTKPTTGKDVMKGVSDETYNKLHQAGAGVCAIGRGGDGAGDTQKYRGAAAGEVQVFL